MEEVPKHANINEGDTIVTSGFSTAFPKGIQIGYISNFSVDKGSANYTIEITLSGDITRAEYVFVVDNTLGSQQDSLVKTTIDE